ncbi:GNAT family N-acetyltransferase [Anaerolineae bacterium CFX9]|nr:GNAT family N-acetyltransferase [Anaerolineae bacterium CFX9]
MRTKLWHSEEVFETLKPEWNALLHRSTTDVIFLTWEWQSTWWKAYQAGELWIVSVHDDDGHLVAIAPWFVHNRDGERVIRTIGCVDVTDYVDIIVDRECVEPVLEALASLLAEHHSAYDRINLCNIPETSPTYLRFPDALRQRQFNADMVLQEVCPVIQLPQTWEDYLSMLDKKQRHELRRKLRKAENEAVIEYHVTTSEADFAHDVDIFIHLMRSSQPAKAEFLDDEKNLRFFRNILRVTFDKGWLRLSFLKVNQREVAAYCDFDYNQHILVYNSGLVLDEYAHLSTGIVLLCYNIRSAIEANRTVFDFLRGNETYKYRMGAVDTRVFKLVARLGVPAAASAGHGD